MAPQSYFNVSIMFPCALLVYLCLSSRDLFIFSIRVFPFLFQFFVTLTSVLFLCTWSISSIILKAWLNHVFHSMFFLQYSPKKDKLFIKMNNPIQMGFLHNAHERGDLFVRVLPVFVDDKNFTSPVERCYTHSNPDNGINNGRLYQAS